ncbi:Obg family GTPase CgtA [Patescibacteria group bacterium]|nr:Obg family GTPase CgtA [Patescibacteria group bacterium]
MFIDEVEITIKAGDGGLGKVSFGKMEKSGPDGGNGGDGGDVELIISSDLTLLNKLTSKRLIFAENGGNGGRNKKTGGKGDDLVVLLPVGSHLEDIDTKEIFEFDRVGKKYIICEGGVGGIGNYDLRSSTNTTPKNTIPPTPGQKRRLKINLRFIADYGLIGLPSAGKSSLLNELTNTNVKTAAYHFTTLSPNLGVLPNKKILADIPGLIEGASEGRGLGIAFLKHIQKVDLLLHCISLESTDPLKDYKIVKKELGKFSKDLLEKEEIILLTKSDLVDIKKLNVAKKAVKILKKGVIVTSIHDNKSLKKLLKIL